MPVFASGSSNLFAIRTPNVNLAAGQVVFVRVIPGNSSGTFRLFLAEVNLAPESGSSVVAVGDTIQNILEHPADVDRFFVHAATPLEFAVFGRSLKDGIAFALGDSADESLYRENKSRRVGFPIDGERGGGRGLHPVPHRIPGIAPLVTQGIPDSGWNRGLAAMGIRSGAVPTAAG